MHAQRALPVFIGALFLAALAACEDEAVPPPVPAPAVQAPRVTAAAEAPPDAGSLDSGDLDAGALDAGDAAAGAADAGDRDAGAGDGGAADAGPSSPAADALDGGVPGSLGPGAIVTVLSIPTGASVFRDADAVGVTPAKVPVKAGVKHLLRVERDGFHTEAREVQRNVGEDVTLTFDLRPASRLTVTSDPAGASVLVRGKPALEKTPGTTEPLDPGPAEVVVSMPGYQPVTRQLVFASAQERFEVALVAGVLVRVESSPRKAEVSLDGVVVGQTPLDLTVDPRGKHTLQVTRPGWSTFKKVLSKVRGGEKVVVKLTDVELAAAKKRVAKAQDTHDRANRALEKLQGKLAATEEPSTALEAQVAAAEQAMERTTQELEAAEAALRALEERRLAEAERDAPK